MLIFLWFANYSLGTATIGDMRKKSPANSWFTYSTLPAFESYRDRWAKPLMFIALNSWFWPVRACLPSGWAKGLLCRHVNVLASVTCTLVVNYTTLQRVTPTGLHCQVQSCRHLHASVAQLKLDSENVLIWTQNARLHHVFHPSASTE